MNMIENECTTRIQYNSPEQEFNAYYNGEHRIGKTHIVGTCKCCGEPIIEHISVHGEVLGITCECDYSTVEF